MQVSATLGHAVCVRERSIYLEPATDLRWLMYGGASVR
jgi:hypothetical protein